MAVAVFNYTAWSARYPEFASAVNSASAAVFFAEAGLYLDNTDASPVADLGTRGALLNMLTAHIAALSGGLEADGKPNGLVGRISAATEGSVSVTADLTLAPGSAAWFSQTTYGLSFWQATKNLRGARYIPAAPYCPEPWGWRR